MTELKPCPFCGGEAILETVDGNSPEECYIYCPECDFESGVYSEPKFIVEKWNRRADNCGRGMNDNPEGIDLYCYHCGAKMDGVE